MDGISVKTNPLRFEPTSSNPGYFKILTALVKARSVAISFAAGVTVLCIFNFKLKITISH